MDSKIFAKLFDTEIGQVLVKIDVNDEYFPEVRFYFKPEGLGLCSVALEYKDEDDIDSAWSKAEFNFNKIDESSALKMVQRVTGELNL